MRTKKPVQNDPILSEGDLEATVGEVADLIVQRAALTDQMNAEIVALKQRYESELSKLSERIERETDRVHDYVRTHPDIIPPGRKSRELIHGIIGYRTGMPQVKTIKGWTLKSALDACLRYRPKWVRQTPSLDKEQIIADLSVGGVAESVGITVVQEETFFISPKLEHPETASAKPRTEHV